MLTRASSHVPAVVELQPDPTALPFGEAALSLVSTTLVVLLAVSVALVAGGAVAWWSGRRLGNYGVLEVGKAAVGGGLLGTLGVGVLIVVLYAFHL